MPTEPKPTPPEGVASAAPVVENPWPFTPALDKLLHFNKQIDMGVRVAAIQQVAGCDAIEARLIASCYGYKRNIATERYIDGRLIDAGTMIRKRIVRVAGQRPQVHVEIEAPTE